MGSCGVVKHLFSRALSAFGLAIGASETNTKVASGTHVAHPALKGASKFTQEARHRPEECVRPHAGQTTVAGTACHETPQLATKRHVLVILACWYAISEPRPEGAFRRFLLSRAQRRKRTNFRASARQKLGTFSAKTGVLRSKTPVFAQHARRLSAM